MDYDEVDLNNILNTLNSLGIKVDIPEECIDTNKIAIVYNYPNCSTIIATFDTIDTAYQALYCMSISYYALREKILNFLYPP